MDESERVEKEKEELRAALQDAVERVQEEHQRDLLELEQRLKASYQDEWSAAHQTYRDEADKCRALMQQQVWPTTLSISPFTKPFTLKSRHILSIFRLKGNQHLSLSLVLLKATTVTCQFP